MTHQPTGREPLRCLVPVCSLRLLTWLATSVARVGSCMHMSAEWVALIREGTGDTALVTPVLPSPAPQPPLPFFVDHVIHAAWPDALAGLQRAVQRQPAHPRPAVKGE